jgi:hypothetical protein
MELEGSLPCSKEPSTSPYHQPVESLPHFPVSQKYFNMIQLAVRVPVYDFEVSSYITDFFVKTCLLNYCSHASYAK